MPNGPNQLPPFAAVSCSSNRLDLFTCRSDGEVYTSVWVQGRRWTSISASWKSLGGKNFPPNAPVSAISRHTDRLDLFVIGSDGYVYNLYWAAGAGWCSYWRIIGGSFSGFPPGTPITAVAPTRGRIHLFACDFEGIVRQSFWHHDRGWSKSWPPVGTVRRCKGAVAAVAYDTDHVDLFALGMDNLIHTKSMIGTWDQWTSGWRSLQAPDVGLTPNAVVTAVSCDPGQAKILIHGQDDNVYVASWNHPDFKSNDPLPKWHSLGGMCARGSCVSAISRQPSHIDVFIVGKSGRVYTNWHSKKSGWSTRPWKPISVRLASPSSLIAVARNPQHLDVFVVTTDKNGDEVSSSFWPHQEGLWYGSDSQWRSLGILPSIVKPSAVAIAAPHYQGHGSLSSKEVEEQRWDMNDRAITLFDAPSIDDRGPHRKSSVINSAKWIRELQSSINASLSSDQRTSEDKKVKVAVIDSGVDLKHDAFRLSPIKNSSCKSFLDKEASMEDKYGHGTFTAALVQKIAPNAELHIARVCVDNELHGNGEKRVAEAIDWAVSQGVDIISISLGFSGSTDISIRKAITNAQQWRDDGSQILIFAAASNIGANSSSAIAYPAGLTGVFCIFSSSTMGKESTFSPKGTTETYPNLSTLGEHVTSAWPNPKALNLDEKADAQNVLSGTSAATPIAAAIAALILEFGKNAEAYKIKDSFEGLGTVVGMRAVMKKIASKNDNCHFLSSQIFGGMPPSKVAALISQELWDVGFRRKEES